MISKEFRKQLISEKINPEEILKFTSKYNIKTDKIVTFITMEDGTKHTIVYNTVWYASRKNKKW